MGDNSGYQNTLKRGDPALFFSEKKQKYYRKSRHIMEFPDESMQISYILTPMYQITTLLNGEEEELFVDGLPNTATDINNLYSVPVVNSQKTTNNVNNNIIITNSPNNNTTDGEIQEFVINILRNTPNHNTTVDSQRLVLSQENGNNNNNTIITISSSSNNNNEYESMTMEQDAQYTEESCIILNQDEHKSIVSSKTKNKKRTTTTKNTSKSSKKLKLSPQLETPAPGTQKKEKQKKSKGTSTKVISCEEDYDFGQDVNVTAAFLDSLMVEKFAHLEPQEDEPCSSKTPLASVPKKFKNDGKSRKRKAGDVILLNAKGQPCANEVERASQKASSKNYNGPELQKDIEKFHIMHQKEVAEKREARMSGFAKCNNKLETKIDKPSATTATTEPFTFTYKRYGNRWRLWSPQIRSKLRYIKEKPTNAKPQINGSSNNDNNNTNQNVTEEDVASDLSNLEQEEGTHVVGVVVEDDINNYSALAKKYNVQSLNSTEDNSTPPPVKIFKFADSGFDLPYLIFHCSKFKTDTLTSTLLANPENITLKFQNEEVPKDERPHSYLCVLFHVLRARLVMTILTRTSTTPISTTFASCIRKCPTARDVSSTWEEEAHQKKFSRDIIALGGNVVGHRPKFLLRDILNELLPNLSAGRRIFEGKLKADEDVKSTIMYFLLDAYYEAKENAWIQLEIQVQKTIMDKKISKCDQGKLCKCGFSIFIHTCNY